MIDGSCPLMNNKFPGTKFSVSSYFITLFSEESECLIWQIPGQHSCTGFGIARQSYIKQENIISYFYYTSFAVTLYMTCSIRAKVVWFLIHVLAVTEQILIKKKKNWISDLLIGQDVYVNQSVTLNFAVYQRLYGLVQFKVLPTWHVLYVCARIYVNLILWCFWYSSIFIAK